MEVFVPDLCRFTDQQTVRATSINEQVVNIEASQLDPVSQSVITRHILLSSEGIRMFPVNICYAWRAELDLMAQISRLTLHQRWASWTRGVFSRDSKTHISVFRR